MVSNPWNIHLGSIFWPLVDLYFYGNFISIFGSTVVDWIETESEFKIGITKVGYMDTLVEFKFFYIYWSE